jgi:hypothetical protein
MGREEAPKRESADNWLKQQEIGGVHRARDSRFGMDLPKEENPAEAG